jgi:hypothetical protein
VVDSEISNITIYGFTQDGIHLEECQWINFEKVISSSNGNYGATIIRRLNGNFCNNNVFKRCKFEKNGVGGVSIGASVMNSFYGCTFQFSQTGYGAYLFGDTNGSFHNTFDGCHFEGNRYHVMINDLQVESTVIHNSWFGSDSTVVERFIYNKGDNTVVSKSGTNGTNLKKTNGTNAPYMNGINDGYLILENCKNTGSADSFACFDDGTNVGATPHPRIYITTWSWGNIDFYGSLAFDGYGASNHNYLKVGSKYVWVDAIGRIRTSSTLPSADLSGTAIQSVAFGGTAQRPTKPNQGEFYFDGNINKPIWCKTAAILDGGGNVTTAAVWVDATGATV